MATSKYKSPHDRALIAFGSDVLEIMERNKFWSGDTFDELDQSARNFGLATVNGFHEFIAIPRERFRNPLSL